MKRSVCLPLVVALVLVSPSAFAASDYEEGVKELTKTIVAEAGKLQKQNLAVVDFTDLQGNVTSLGRFLAEELSASLVMAGGVRVVDRNQLNKIFQEHSLSMLGISDPAAVKKVGKVAGADALVTGSITEMGDSVRVTAKVMATDTALVIAAARTTIPKTGTIAELIKQGVEAPGTKQPEQRITKESTLTGKSPREMPKFENQAIRVTVKSLRKEGNVLKVELVYRNLLDVGKPNIPLFLNPNGNRYIADDEGEQWVLQPDNDFARGFFAIAFPPQVNVRVPLTFTASSGTSGKAFNLVMDHLCGNKPGDCNPIGFSGLRVMIRNIAAD